MRRLLIAPLALLAVGSAGCSTFSRNDTVASIGDAELTRDDFEDMVDSDLGRQLVNELENDDRVAGDAARQVITAWIVSTGVADVSPIDPAELEAAGSQAEQSFGAAWTDAPEPLRELVRLNSAIGTLNQSGVIDTEAVRTSIIAADVYVDPRYGRWDVASLSVEPLGGAPPPTDLIVS